ncbi:50S ribosomal protein L19 [Candidatus Saccharibacteria bacterium]|nr:50S ribosomal protein L19 [Candidatus Saccharibacteria bacterium]
MQSVIEQVNASFAKSAVVDVRSGDTVRVHQKIKEGKKERVQVFEGLVIRVDRKNSHTARITVRRMSGGIGVEKSYLLHSPLVLKVEVVKRSKVRRNYLTYMRSRTGKSARMTGVDFDKEAVNAVHDEKAEAEEAKMHEKAEADHEAKAAKESEKEAELEKKAAEVAARHEAEASSDTDTAATEKA